MHKPCFGICFMSKTWVQNTLSIFEWQTRTKWIKHHTFIALMSWNLVGVKFGGNQEDSHKVGKLCVHFPMILINILRRDWDKPPIPLLTSLYVLLAGSFDRSASTINIYCQLHNLFDVLLYDYWFHSRKCNFFLQVR